MQIHSSNFTVPMEILNEEMAQRNHSQSLDRLNERGGMSIFEMACNIMKLSLNEVFQHDKAAAVVISAIRTHATALSASLSAENERLRGLIEEAYNVGVAAFTNREIANYWETFKTENNL